MTLKNYPNFICIRAWKTSLPLFTFLFGTSVVFAQKDTVFWFVAPEVAQGNNNYDRPVAFRFSTYDSPAFIAVSQPANPAFPIQTISIPANTSGILEFPPLYTFVENSPANEVLNKGFLIESSSPITVYYEVIGEYFSNPDIFSLKGRNALGLEFYVPFQDMLDNSNAYFPTPHAAFDIVATEDNTNVIITPAKPIVGHAANVPFSIVLNRGQTYSAEAASQSASGHPSGSRVVSDKPIAITVKDDLVDGGSFFGGFCRDLMGDQIVPSGLTGTRYVVQKGLLDGPESAFVLATADGTTVSFDGSPIAVLNAGETLKLNITGHHFVEASAAVYLWQMSGNACEVSGALLPALDCSGSTSVRFVRTTDETFYLFLVTRNGQQSGFSLNGNTSLIQASDFQVVPGSNGEFVSATIEFPNFIIPATQSSIIENSLGLFQMGFLNGAPMGTGCRFGFFSDFGTPVRVEENATLCEGQTLQLHGLSIYTPGVYQQTITTPEGCDSLFNITVVLAPTDTTYHTAATCDSTQAGIFQVTLSNTSGCDSVIITKVQLLPPIGIFTEINLCNIDSVVIAGVIYTQPGTVAVLIPSNFGGCDTLATYELTRTDVLLEKTIVFCPGESLTIDGITYTEPSILIDTVVVQTGCDTIHTTLLEYGELPQVEREIVLCPGKFVEINGISYNQAAIVTDTINNPGGCDTLRLTTIRLDDDVLPFLPPDTILCQGDVLKLVSPFQETKWNGNYTGSSFEVDAPGTVIAFALNENNCLRRDTIRIETCCSEKGIYVPNIFSPNDDNENDKFCIYPIAQCSDYMLRVYDRWGELLFESRNPDTCWDGSFRGKSLSSGVYVWTIAFYSEALHRQKVISGDITLIR